MKEKIKKGHRRQLVPRGNFFTKGTLIAEKRNARKTFKCLERRQFITVVFSLLLTVTMLKIIHKE